MGKFVSKCIIVSVIKERKSICCKEEGSGMGIDAVVTRTE